MIHHLALDGVMEGALGLGLDVVDTGSRLVRAGMAPHPRRGRPLEQRVVSHDGRPPSSVQGRTLSVEGALELRSLRRGDVVVIPGVFATKDSDVERLLGRADVRRVIALLPQAASKGALLAASCSATFLLGAAGLLDGKRATTTWWLMPFFRGRYPSVDLRPDRMVVDAGNVITAGAAFAHADLILSVVARLTSPSAADLAARYLLLDTRASQARYMVMDHLQSFDPVLRALEQFITENIDRQLSLAELARAVGISPRTLARRVEATIRMTPQRFVQRVRVAHASHLLETTRASVEEVAARVGYADSAAFRRVFRRHAGGSPREHRAPADQVGPPVSASRPMPRQCDGAPRDEQCAEQSPGRPAAARPPAAEAPPAGAGAPRAWARGSSRGASGRRLPGRRERRDRARARAGVPASRQPGPTWDLVRKMVEAPGIERAAA
jgi:transcriptional regulator GlxA family with amidase domain